MPANKNIFWCQLVLLLNANCTIGSTIDHAIELLIRLAIGSQPLHHSDRHLIIAIAPIDLDGGFCGIRGGSVDAHFFRCFDCRHLVQQATQ